ncbi:Ribonuclease H-like domain containing protein [Parasponia andersonii]|uniref:Ribonuclease H-like domain containing protein n=1 Tax=Parasponia andersonii TaxID=3476 RepID=A0A2P5CYB4_PARAD|nr:Ribonuclease H-like domain containing protein [Parasponia andersonii]
MPSSGAIVVHVPVVVQGGELQFLYANAYSSFFEFDDPIVAESATLLEGIRLARDHGFRHVAFEVGCKVVAKAISKHVKDLPWEIQSLTMECNMLLHDFDIWEIEWIPREINTTAHNLAIWCTEFNVSGLIQVSTIPSYVCNSDVTGP